MRARELPTQALPTGTVTFLFTDIEGSTDLLQRVGDQAYGRVLEQHHRLMREAFERVGGHELGTQGDAFFVAFSDAGAAVAAAVAAQRAIAGHAWPEGTVVRVRMGLHTGDPTLGPGGYVGIDVHRAARICSVGYGQQILLSERTRTMAGHSVANGLNVKDLGEHRLKDLARPEHIFQVVIQGLPDTFPPLKSLDARITNLPSLELTSFIGRDQEMGQVKRLLTTSHLVTLLGPGGTGKTRLSLQVAADLIEQFPQGVWLTELAPLSDPSLATQAVATVLGVREMPGRPLIETLCDYLRTRHALIVLDNCEHLIDASAHLVSALLRASPKLKVLATSREPLGTAGEATYRVPPLPGPDPRHAASIEELMQFPATRLFIERAVVSHPRFVVTEANAPAVAQVCRRLDGIPLAIELAAARVKVLPVEHIARRLDDRFRLLTSGFRTALPHHQTLRATVEWSYELLSPAEQTIFRRLSVFAGGFMLEASEAVCAGDGIAGEDVLDLVSRLVDKSLLITEAVEADVRYRMLETLHAYSRERLQESDEGEATKSRHLEWYLRVAERSAPELLGAHQLVWLDRLELEHDNFRAVLEWAKTGGDKTEAGLRLGGALYRFWRLRGHLREGREWLEGLLARGLGASVEARAGAAYGAAVLAFDQGDFGRAELLANESLGAYRRAQDGLGTALSLNALAALTRDRGDYARARALLDESLVLSRQKGQAWALADALNVFGVTMRRQGDSTLAMASFEESMTLWRQLGDKWGLAASLGHLGVLARQQRDYVRARALHEESLALRQELGDRRLVAADLSSLGFVARDLGNYEEARDLLERSLALSRDLGNKLDMAATLGALGSVLYHQGDIDRAAALLQESLTLSLELGHKMNSAAALCVLGFVAAAKGDGEGAVRFHTESLTLHQELGDAMGIATSLLGLARVAVIRNQPEVGARLLAAADASRQTKAASWSPADRTEFEHTLVTIRGLLSEEAFAAAWADGHATPLENLKSYWEAPL